jgi:hypothetical protein
MEQRDVIRGLMTMYDRELALGIFDLLAQAENTINKAKEAVTELGAKALVAEMKAGILESILKSRAEAVPADLVAQLHERLLGKQVVIDRDGSGRIIPSGGGAGQSFATVEGFLRSLGFSPETPKTLREALEAFRGHAVRFTDGKAVVFNEDNSTEDLFDTREAFAAKYGFPVAVVTSPYNLYRLTVYDNGVVRANYASFDVSDIYEDTFDAAAIELEKRAAGANEKTPLQQITEALHNLAGYRIEIHDDGTSERIDNDDDEVVETYETLEELAEDIGIPVAALRHDSLGIINGFDGDEYRIIYKASSNHDLWNGTLSQAANILLNNQDTEPSPEPSILEVMRGLGDAVQRARATSKLEDADDGTALYDLLMRRRNQRGS